MIQSSQLIAIRHAPTTLQGICYGQSKVPVQYSASQVAKMIEEQLDEISFIPNYIWSSPLDRCAQVATLLSQSLLCSLKIDTRLLELNFGEWEGKAWADLSKEDPTRFTNWMENWYTEPAPQGESTQELQARMSTWLTDLNPEEHHLYIGHAGPIRAIQVLTHSKETWTEAFSCPVQHITPYPFSLKSKMS